MSLRRGSAPAAPVSRQSRGLEQFFFNVRDLVGLSILDLAGASQENIGYLTSLGHKVYSEDLVRGLDDAFGLEPSEQTNASRIDYFLRSNFDYPAETFDGVLLWDSLQFMGPALLTATVDRLYDVMRPNSYLLAYFTANDRVREVPSHTFRLVDNKTVLIAERGIRPSGQVFNNRNLEKLFTRFQSVKFFLTKENLREVIVKR
ncbi:MAG: class I SAM-dependent methyltransferase [Acidobacteriota bacterium]